MTIAAASDTGSLRVLHQHRSKHARNNASKWRSPEP